MTSSKDDREKQEQAPQDGDPRAAALRANLAKRKGQSNARRAGKAVGKKESSVFDTLDQDEK